MSSDFWSKGAKVREWLLPRKGAAKAGQSRVNSWGGEDGWFSTNDSEFLCI